MNTKNPLSVPVTVSNRQNGVSSLYIEANELNPGMCGEVPRFGHVLLKKPSMKNFFFVQFIPEFCM